MSSQTSTSICDDTISISSTLPSASSIAAPEIPRRSNSIISMTSHNSSFNQTDHNQKPLVSPRHLHSTISPKVLDPLTEDFRSLEMHQSPDPVSPSIHAKPRTSIHQHHNSTKFNDFNEKNSPSYNPSSPRFVQQGFYETNGPLPISPHVNVHPSALSFNHNPPPVPPRKRNPVDITNSQKKQAKDAPPLQPRMNEESPPPRPPKTIHSNHKNNHHDHINETSYLVRFFKCSYVIDFSFIINIFREKIHIIELD